MEFPLGQRLRELPGPLLLTGHTGFKGTWMTFLLERLSIPVVGYSLEAEKDSLYDRAERIGSIPEVFADIRNYETLGNFIDLHRPSAIIHMAAQPLVLRSYENPRETFDVNVVGTVNVLDIAFKRDFVEAIIIVTTDKVYKNDNSGRAFVETDPLEGKDPYSSSKVATEAVVTAWQQIAKISGGPRVTSVRAGNVIGGGDFAENRIIPDIIRGALTGNPVIIRNPQSTRPWQHVLDPLTGYLLLLEYALSNREMTNLNFGPKDRNLTVKEITQFAKLYFSELILNFEDLSPSQSTESLSLNLNSDASSRHLNWRPSFSQEQAAKMAFIWWKKLMNNEATAQELCLGDIESSLKSRI